MMNRQGFLALLAASRVRARDFPSRSAKLVKLFRSPDGHPNGLETASEGFWIGEQVTDRATWLIGTGRCCKASKSSRQTPAGSRLETAWFGWWQTARR
jgi:hypothetical protein